MILALKLLTHSLTFTTILRRYQYKEIREFIFKKNIYSVGFIPYRKR